MTVDRYLRVIAGVFIIVSLALGAQASPVYVSAWFLLFTAFVGLNLFQFGFSNWCLMGSILRALGVRDV